MATTGLLFAACSKDAVEPKDDGGGVATNPTGDAWISLDISNVNSGFSRGLNTPDEQNGTNDESKVTNVRAIFFDTSLQVTTDILLTDAQAGTPGQGSGTPGKAFKIPVKSKYILIVANAPASFTEKGEGTSFAAVNTALEDVVANVTVAEKFMMSNAKGYLEPSYVATDPEVIATTKKVGDLKELTLYTSASAAEGKPLTLNIDRVVAKVRVFITAASDAGNVNMANGGWVLNITNKKFFPVSERLLTWNENPANIGARGTCITPFDQYKIGSYRKDPNYDLSNVGIYNEADLTAFKANYNYYTNDDDPEASDWLNSGASTYCHENTQDADYNKHAYTTQVLLKANFAPKVFKNGKGETDVTNSSATISWMKIYSGFYTFETLKNWIRDEYNSKYASTVPDHDAINAPLVKAVNAYLTAKTSVVERLPLPDNADFTATYGDDVAQVLQAMDDVYAAIQTGITTAGANAYYAADDTHVFSYYDGGVNYYKIMIRHDDTDAAANKLGEFGVVRNSVYDVNVTKFNNPGYPIIVDPKPEEVDEDDESWLAIQIDVNPWTWYSQSIEL